MPFENELEELVHRERIQTIKTTARLKSAETRAVIHIPVKKQHQWKLSLKTHITAIRNDTNNTMDNRMTITKWEGKQLYGRFKWLINNISHDKTGHG